MIHSAFPWRVSPLDRRVVEDAEGQVVCDVRSWRDTDDALILAAAPELLAALKQMLSEHDEPRASSNSARAAIDKAEGR